MPTASGLPARRTARAWRTAWMRSVPSEVRHRRGAGLGLCGAAADPGGAAGAADLGCVAAGQPVHQLRVVQRQRQAPAVGQEDVRAGLEPALPAGHRPAVRLDESAPGPAGAHRLPAQQEGKLMAHGAVCPCPNCRGGGGGFWLLLAVACAAVAAASYFAAKAAVAWLAAHWLIDGLLLCLVALGGFGLLCKARQRGPAGVADLCPA